MGGEDEMRQQGYSVSVETRCVMCETKLTEREIQLRCRLCERCAGQEYD